MHAMTYNRLRRANASGDERAMGRSDLGYQFQGCKTFYLEILIIIVLPEEFPYRSNWLYLGYSDL